MQVDGAAGTARREDPTPGIVHRGGSHGDVAAGADGAAVAEHRCGLVEPDRTAAVDCAGIVQSLAHGQVEMAAAADRTVALVVHYLGRQCQRAVAGDRSVIDDAGSAANGGRFRAGIDDPATAFDRCSL